MSKCKIVNIKAGLCFNSIKWNLCFSSCVFAISALVYYIGCNLVNGIFNKEKYILKKHTFDEYIMYRIEFNSFFLVNYIEFCFIFQIGYNER